MINNVNETLIGKKVRFVGKPDSESYEAFAPDYNAIGTITDVCYGDIEVEWPKGSVVNDGGFWYTKNELELMEEMTNEEIWEMLKPKFNKNKLEGLYVRIDRYGYVKEDVYNAIALAYRSGYERALKGRPFKIGEKKKKGGHWEPVDPNNLPKEGTMVRYSRESKDYSDCKIPLIVLGDLGKVDITPEKWFGVRLDNPRSPYSWISFEAGGIANCLDMWVEDDE